MVLTFATYNIAHCLNFKNATPTSPAKIDFESTASVIKNIDADVIGLNEVYDYPPSEVGSKNQTEVLANELNIGNFTFAKGTEFEWNAIIGNAVLSKHKIIEVQSFPVPAPLKEELDPNDKGWYEDRVILKVTVDVGTKINFISTHFGLNPIEQQRMVKKLTEILDSESLPCVLTGDFNALPRSEILKPIYDRLTSAADVTNKTFIPTWSSFNPVKTLDYLFFSSHFKVIEYDAVDVVSSDHRPVYAKVNLDF